MKVVAGGLVVFDAVFFRDELRIGSAADRVVPADGIGGDGGEDAAHVGVQAVGGRAQVKDMLALERVGHVVALSGVAGVVEEDADVGAAVEIDEAEGLAAGDQGALRD